MAVRTARQKAALRKAQLASARKRRGHGRARKIGKVVATGAAIGAVAYAGHKGRHAIRDHALQKRHGGDYVPRKAKYHHYTNSNAARKIVKHRSFKPTGKHAGHGHSEGVWLTRHSKRGHYDGETRDVFGKARVTVKLKRSHVLKHRTHSIPGGLSKSNKHVSHIQIHKSGLAGKRMKHNLPKTSRGVRRRYTAHRRMGSSSYGAGKNIAVSPIRRRIKRATKRRRRR